jgi:hypothetical protein
MRKSITQAGSSEAAILARVIKPARGGEGYSVIRVRPGWLRP